MSEIIKRFQEKKEEMVNLGWIIVDETETKVTLKDTEDVKGRDVLTLLDTQTAELLTTFPNLTNALMTLFSNSEEGDFFVEVDLTFDMFDKTHSLRAFFDPFLEQESIQTVLMLLDAGEKPCSLALLDTREKTDLFSIYTKYKQIISELPQYRLYFATKTISFDEEAVIGWL